MNSPPNRKKGGTPPTQARSRAKPPCSAGIDSLGLVMNKTPAQSITTPYPPARACSGGENDEGSITSGRSTRPRISADQRFWQRHHPPFWISPRRGKTSEKPRSIARRRCTAHPARRMGPVAVGCGFCTRASSHTRTLTTPNAETTRHISRMFARRHRREWK